MAVLTDELNLPRDTTVDEITKDATLQDTNTALGLLAKDTTLAAINTALGALAKDTSVQGITTAMSAINTALAALASLAKDTTLQATNTALGSLAKDNSLQAVGTALADVATDTTLGATNTALGNIITQLQAIATAISQSGGSSDYEQLSNRPQINSTVLSGNKTGSALGLSDAADISGLVLSGTTNTTGQSIAAGTYFYLNGDLVKAIAAIANGATFTLNTNYEIVTVGSELSSLNSALTKYTLLWTNSDPTADFASQRILANVDISSYSEILIETSHGNCYCVPGAIAYSSIYGTGAGIYYCFTRYFDCRVTNNGISISNDDRIKIADGTYSTANNMNIPLKVYGIKKPT